MIIDEVIAGVVTAVEGAAVTSDTGAPSQFNLFEDGPLEESTQDRSFVIDATETDSEWITGIQGRTDRYVTFDVVVRFVNEARSTTEFSKLILQDIHRIQDRVFAYFFDGNVSNAGPCVTAGPARIEADAEPSVRYARIPFRCDYVDDVVTS